MSSNNNQTVIKQNLGKRTFFIILSLLLIFGFKYLPAPQGISGFGMQVLGLFLGMLVSWLAVSISWTSILCLLALSILPGMDVASVLKYGFGNWLFIFLICTFAITYTLSRTQFIRRCVFFLVSRRFAQKNPWKFIIFFFASITLIGLFTHSTVLFLIFLPIAEDIFAELGLKPGDRTATMIIMGLVICCAVSGGMTPIAHTFPLISLAFYTRDTGLTIDYATYSFFGIIVGTVILLLMLLVFKFLFRPDLSAIKDLNIDRLKDTLGPMDRKEKITLIVFGLVILCWLLPGITKSFAPAFSDTISAYGNALPPMVGLVILSIITDKGKPILDFTEAMKNGVPWAAVFMACSILALGSIMTLDEVGLVDYLITELSPLANNLSVWMFVLVFVLWVVVQTNFSSNMVTLTVGYTVAMPLAIASGFINPAAMACIIGAGSTFAFATPAATTHVAIACGTPWLSAADLLKYGLVMVAITLFVLIFVGYPVLSFFLPVV